MNPEFKGAKLPSYSNPTLSLYEYARDYSERIITPKSFPDPRVLHSVEDFELTLAFLLRKQRVSLSRSIKVCWRGLQNSQICYFTPDVLRTGAVQTIRYLQQGADQIYVNTRSYDPLPKNAEDYLLKS